ncbi:MAG TPA: hypothetical protein PLI60_02100 [Anaerolineaceae bacterium]|nr:hypothetical protein [Anaerolineaceae bacterium]HQN03849.1 hypothetical protein [Anaerolineaceae bacterium]HQP07441.1 hypothetical protein [Anaerolineaceae bacterium]
MEETKERSFWKAFLAASFLLVSLGVLFFFIAENFNLIEMRFLLLAAAGLLAIIAGTGIYLNKKWANVASGLVMAATGVVLIVRSIIAIIHAFPANAVFDLASGSLLLVILPLGISLIAVGITYFSGGKNKI